MALSESGHLYGWGWNKFGQLGIGHNIDQNAPQMVSALVQEVIDLLPLTYHFHAPYEVCTGLAIIFLDRFYHKSTKPPSR